VKYKKRLWTSAFVVLVGSYLLLNLAFYLGNTQVGASNVFGVYGRYFLPLLPVLLVAALTSKATLKVERLTVVGTTIAVILLGLVGTFMSIG
jgi:uncharacterized membrane protein